MVGKRIVINQYICIHINYFIKNIYFVKSKRVSVVYNIIMINGAGGKKKEKIKNDENY